MCVIFVIAVIGLYFLAGALLSYLTGVVLGVVGIHKGFSSEDITRLSNLVDDSIFDHKLIDDVMSYIVWPVYLLYYIYQFVSLVNYIKERV